MIALGDEPYGGERQGQGPEEQAVITRQRWEFSYGHRREDWPGRLPEGCEPARDEFDLPLGKVSGRRCDGWRRMTGDEGYFAACSCGWRGTETGHVSLMLRQVEDHVDAVRAVRGGRPSARAAQARAGTSARSAFARGGQISARGSCTRWWKASSYACRGPWSTQLTWCRPARTRPRFVAVLEHAAARVAPEWAKTGAAVRREEALQRQAERAKGWRDGIVAAAGALAAIAQEVALAGQDLETCYRGGSAEYRRLAGEPANRHGGREVMAG